MHRMLLVRPFITRSATNPDDSNEPTIPYGYVSRKAFAATILAVAIVAGIIGSVLGRLHVSKDCTDDGQHSTHAHTTSTEDSYVPAPDNIGSYVDPKSILSYLRDITAIPHVAGTPQDLQQARDLKNLWEEQGLDEVSLVPYDVLLSYPDKQKPNKIYLLNSRGEEEFVTSGIQTALHSPEENSPLLLTNFNAYSSRGEKEGKLVYINYGREEDFDYVISKRNIQIKGKIVMARYGKIFRANIVKLAEKYGAIGVILFSDPKDFAPRGKDYVYPDSIYMPGMAVQSGTTYLHNGDPLTPLLPSVDGMYRTDESETDLPSIPVQSIGYQEAEIFLRHLAGPEAPLLWRGDLNVTYRLGPELLPGFLVRMDIKTENVRAKTYNVIGTLRGAVEPDRYVILGNHRDAWTFGSIDPSSGSASLMEIVRIFTKIKKEKGWRPYRSLVFCSWGAEEYGLVGSIEWIEEYMNSLSYRTVAYLNVDLAIEGNASLKVEGVPLLYNAIYTSAKKIPNPDPKEVAAGRPTVYDTWYHTTPQNDSNKPVIHGIGSGSDYTGFIHYLGIPSVDLRYTYSQNVSSFPLYHTLYETFYLVDRMYDAGGQYMAAVTRMWLELATLIADVKLLPFGLHDYSAYLTKEVESFKTKYGHILQNGEVSLHWLTQAVHNFSSKAEEYEQEIKSVDSSNPLKTRQINDQLMQIERCFLNPRGLPNRPDTRHVLFAPSTQDAYSFTSFAGLVDLIEIIQKSSEQESVSIWKDLKRHLSEVVYRINSATHIMNVDLHNRRES